MKCGKCGGLMAHEKYYGREDHFFGWKCVWCGDVVDEVILKNRREQAEI